MSRSVKESRTRLCHISPQNQINQMVSLILGFLDELYLGDLSSFTQHLVIPNLYELISSVKHNLRKKNSHTVEIKSNQNGLVTLFKIFFVFNRRKSFGTI